MQLADRCSGGLHPVSDPSDVVDNTCVTVPVTIAFTDPSLGIADGSGASRGASPRATGSCRSPRTGAAAQARTPPLPE